MRIKWLGAALAAAALVSSVALENRRALATSDADRDYPLPVVGDPGVLAQKYEAWKDAVGGEEHGTTIGLLGSSLLPDAQGLVRFDVERDRVSVDVDGLDRPADVWLIEHGDGEDQSELLGRLVPGADGNAVLETGLDAGALADFGLDYVAVVPAGADPAEARLLSGRPSIFHRYLAWELANEAQRRSSGGGPGLALLMLVPPASGPLDDVADLMSALVAKGEFLFFEETFEGNGRTCGSCHPAGDNLTIDAEFIDTLPNDDPLFVAERVPALNSDLNGGLRFEIPELMRRFAVILENVDGMDNLAKKFAMRGVPHTLGMRTSIERAFPPGTPGQPDESTGWSGDGTPFEAVVLGIQVEGRLLDFPVGAINQHFPKTLERDHLDGVGAVFAKDFRAPKKAELEAMLAFQLSLGRQVDLDLNTLVLNDVGAQTGLELFRDGSPPGSFTCNTCHNNAGANTGGANIEIDTGVEEFLQNRIDEFDGTGQPRPPDGGFGTTPGELGLGNQAFNVTSVVELADTLPAFHNNIVDTVEDSILFYRSQEFTDEGFPAISFGNQGTAQVAAFMRVINSIDNIENSALRHLKRAYGLVCQPSLDPLQIHDAVNRLLQLAIADLQDTVDVLNEQGLHPDAVEYLEEAIAKIRSAMAPLQCTTRQKLIEEAAELALKARDAMKA